MFAQNVMEVSRTACGGPPLPTPNPGRDAIAHTMAINVESRGAAFKLLYDFGGEPLTPDVAAATGAVSPAFTVAAMARFGMHFDEAEQGCWQVWTRPDLDDQKPPVFKVYLNPRYAAFGRLCLRLPQMLLDHRVAGFKTVGRRWMALRPDKLIVYFDRADHRQDWIEEISDQISDLPANPTPFTEFACPSGLITMGTDPTDLPGQSWRSCLLRQIARRLIPTVCHSVDEVMEGLLETGVDPVTWKSIT